MRIVTYCCYTILLIPVLLSGTAFAQDNELEVTIDILEPSEEPGGMAPGIQYLEEEMSRSPLKFQSYLNLASAFRTIPLGKEETINFKLRRYLKLVIIPIKVSPQTVQFSLKIWADKHLILDTDLSLVKSGTVMVGVAGKPDLIIAISEGF
ncbi:MAG: hypothetical protein RAO92_03515 [Candidatus Euphemobacter frigidus]|nr:hypothetical protein [Candidatus Euphemobacter frigidus]MDP8275450.1 hypothetical protein [Candidatus Euphemobacter frigidus]